MIRTSRATLVLAGLCSACPKTTPDPDPDSDTSADSDSDSDGDSDSDTDGPFVADTCDAPPGPTPDAGTTCDAVGTDEILVPVLVYDDANQCFGAPHFVARPADRWAAYTHPAACPDIERSALVVGGGCAILPVDCGPLVDDGFIVPNSTCPATVEGRGLCGGDEVTAWRAIRPWCQCDGFDTVPINGHWWDPDQSCWRTETRLVDAGPWRAWACSPECLSAPGAMSWPDGACVTFNSMCDEQVCVEGAHWEEFYETCWSGQPSPWEAEARCE